MLGRRRTVNITADDKAVVAALRRRSMASTDLIDEKPGKRPLRKDGGFGSSSDGGDSDATNSGMSDSRSRNTSSTSQTNSSFRSNPLTRPPRKAATVQISDAAAEGATAAAWCPMLRMPHHVPAALKSSSFFLLGPYNRARVLVYNVTKHRVFEAIVILLIVANCVFLAIADPTLSDAEQPAYIATAELFFTAAFSCEMVLKMFSLGLVLHRGAYLRDTWNVLDCFIVVLSYLNFIPGFGNFTALRTLRVLRPLRSMNAVKGLKVLVVGLLRSVGGLLNVAMLAMFIFCIFGILGVQLWGGQFRRRCRDIATQVVLEDSHCRDPSLAISALGRDCPAGQECVDWHNPHLGFMHFDDVPSAFLIVFQVITFENWSELLFITYDLMGPVTFIYFFFLIVIGSYFVPNLALAVINEKFQSAQRKQELLDQLESEKQAQLRHVRSVRVLGIAAATAGATPQTQPLAAALHAATADAHHSKEKARHSKGGDKSALGALGAGHPGIVEDLESPDNNTHADIEVQSVESNTTALCPMNLGPSDGGALLSGSVTPNRRASLGVTSHDGEAEARQLHRRSSPSLWLRFRDAVHNVTEGAPLLTPDGEERGIAEREVAYAEADASTFTKIIIGFIMLNTISLASQHHNQPLWLDETLEITNIVFTAVFTAEFALKLIALGFRLFVMDPFNDLDAFVVIFSIVELFLAGSNTVSVFRALRLLRVLKLLKRFPSLRQIILVVLGAMSNTVYLCLIMLLYLFIASLAGMQFFGGTFGPLEKRLGRPIRWHFDTFIQAFYTVFQVLSRDKWIDVMHDAMAATNPAASIYFIVVIVVGVYVILSLFLSILIASFEKQAEVMAVDEAELTLNQRLREIREKMVQAVAKKFRLSPPDDPRTAMPLLPEIAAVVGASHPEPRSPSDKPFGAFDVSDPLGRGRLTLSPSALGLALVTPDAEVCRRCGTVPTPVLPTPPLVRQFSAEEHHASICWMCELRMVKASLLADVARYVEHFALQADTHSTTPAATTSVDADATTGAALAVQEHAEVVIRQLRAGGMMMRRFAGEFTTWGELRRAIEAEAELLGWEIGEEQIGGSLITYTRANLKHVHRTNGGDSLFIFGAKNPIRVAASELTSSPYFDNFILLCIALSSLALAADNPRDDQTSLMYRVLFWFDVGFTVVFVSEMLLKIVARGFIGIEGSYLRDPWNVLDAVIVIISLISLSLEGVNLSFLKVLRTFRALRPLRVIHRNRGLKMVVRTLLQSVKGIANVALLSTLNYLIFGILGVQLFAGKLHTCTDPTVLSAANCSGTYFDVKLQRNVSREWASMQKNFDNIGNSMLTLFEVSTGEQWSTVLYAAIDGWSTTEAPRRDNNVYIGLFFVLFFVVSNFLLINLFIGVVISNFNSVKSQIDGLSLLTDEQKLWIESQRIMLNFRPVKAMLPRKNNVSQAAFRVVGRNEFEAFIGVAIILNILTIALDHHGMSATWVLALEIVNYIFVVVFLFEAVAKLTAFGVNYFNSGWNRFDFFLVVLSLVGAALDLTGTTVLPINVGLLRVFRVFRILRILRLVKQARKVRILVETLWYSLPSIGNISVFMLLFFFIYSVMGVQLFAKLQTGGEYFDDKYANYQNFWNAMQLQFIFMTGEDFNSAMWASMVQEPKCSGDACGTPFAPLFYISFILIASFTVSQLFIAIIISNFETTLELDKSSLTMQDLHRYVAIWAQFDPDATMLVRTDVFPSLLAALQPPLGISRKYSRLEVLRKSSRYRVPERGGMVHFVETLIPLARACLDVDLTEREIREHEESWKLSFPGLDQLPEQRYRNARVCINAYFCSTYLAAAYRRRKARKLLDKMREERRREIADYIATHGAGSAAAPTAQPQLFQRRGNLPDGGGATATTAAFASADDDVELVVIGGARRSTLPPAPEVEEI